MILRFGLSCLVAPRAQAAPTPTRKLLFVDLNSVLSPTKLISSFHMPLCTSSTRRGPQERLRWALTAKVMSAVARAVPGPVCVCVCVWDLAAQSWELLSGRPAASLSRCFCVMCRYSLFAFVSLWITCISWKLCLWSS